jgi:hypothetical protein
MYGTVVIADVKATFLEADNGIIGTVYSYRYKV